MLNPFDLEQMQADLETIRNDNPVSIVLRRGKVTLAAQTVRITRGRPGRASSGTNTSEARADALIVGAVDLDIARGDRFNANGVLFEVTFVRPDLRAGVIAEATLSS